MAVSVCSCPNCGGVIRYNIVERAFSCDQCSSKFTLEEMQKAYPDQQNDSIWSTLNEGMQSADNKSVENKSIGEEKEARMKTYTCPACGAEVMTGSDTLAAAFCAYCRNPVTISERLVSGNDFPSRMIPFKVSSDEAAEIFRRKIKNKPLLPTIFKNTIKKNEFQSVYVPFKLFDADCSSCVTAKCTNSTSWRAGEYEYTKTDIYEARRSGSMEFCAVPADASEKIEDQEMQAIEPFDTAALIPFSKNFLLGHFAESPTANQESLIDTVFARIKPAAEKTLLSTIKGYDSVEMDTGNTSVDRISSEYVMLPVWLMTVKYKDTDHVFTINGQTGKFGGKFPVDWMCALGLFARLSAIIFFGTVVVWEVLLWIFG